ncbi:hypothetical protein QBC32DRAFT_218475 [Pseudoneurospora amorphoporcata]|uniref:Uncharacterized protein n=1 Tax=Pseudoneurospora amorphoporcata TaxID=241081 RepID=A0AAN6NQG8_9PEZI|nr:hypothetical protein QBC32DRAFT_218475 [Pseudoneurospora amorphoporcata]
MNVGAEGDMMETRPSELISVSKLGDIDRSWVSVDGRSTDHRSQGWSYAMYTQKLVETWGSKFWKEWKLGRVGFRQALWTSMWFQMTTSRRGHERVHPIRVITCLSFMSEFGAGLYHGPLEQP